ncbi:MULTISPECIES: ferredoxin reductase family protein [Kribbella]|uniref:Ferric reductase-like transmembrane domain-containing protein n=1 Tax=Kribbella karoonensis TaxID=324851 RepID=A0ABN2CU41_9ACTN
MTGMPVAVLPGRRARTDGAVRLGSLAVLWLALLLVAYWWIAAGGVQELGGWATGLTSIGRLTGLGSAVLLLAQVVLMARVPVLEAAFGQDRLARIHRLTGFTSFNLMLAHLVTITWGYAAGELGRTPATLWDLTLHYPGMLLAVGGTIALCLTVLTSIRAVRRRLRYESWHLLHLYAYLGVGLALPHQLWTGQEFLASTGRTVFWWTAWAVAAATVLVYRIGVPVWRNGRHRLRVTAVVPESDGIVSVYVGGRRLDRLRVEAGQFFAWRFLDRPGWTRANPYSLSAAPDGRGLRITVQDAGDGSAALSSLQPGTRVLVEGPYGRMSPRARTQRKIALIGAGVGVTPLRALAEGLDYAPGDAVLVQRYTDRPLFPDEFQKLWHERGLSLLTLPGARRRPDSWFGAGVPAYDDLQALLHWIPDIAERDVYLCGPEAWTDLVRSTLTAAGLPAERLHLETFKW